jgi:glucose-6-phosphate 1-epimerase
MDAFSWIRTPHGELCPQGAHVVRWRARGQEVLFLSRKSRFEPGQPIRGGVPLVFPWFGDDPEGRGRAAHGFARRVLWRVLADERTATETRIELELVDDAATLELWPHRFALRLEARLGDELELALAVENRDETAFTCETALHTYLAVGDVRRIAVHGLEGASYLDKLDGLRRKKAGPAPITFGDEVDRTYVGTSATCRVEDPVLARTLEIAKEGSRSTVVWNPWSTKAARMADLGDDEWTSMVCIESGNVAEDALTLAPGEAHTMRVRLASR